LRSISAETYKGYIDSSPSNNPAETLGPIIIGYTFFLVAALDDKRTPKATRKQIKRLISPPEKD
jgi:hypothetical protein